MEAKEVKLVLVGHTNVGKTCLVRQATTGVFGEDTAPTLGASYVSKLVQVGEEEVRLQIWDTAGQERYRGMTPMYYRGAQVALIVYSVDDPESFEAVDSWLDSLRENADPDIILFLVANKCDLDEREVTLECGQEKAKNIGARYYDVSAKTGQNVEDLFTDIPKLYLEKEAPPKAPAGLQIQDAPANTGKKGCC